MDIRKITIPFVETGTCDAAFEAGLALARHFGSHMDVVHARPRVELPGGMYYPVVMPYAESDYDAQSEAIEAAARALEARFEALCKTHDVPVVALDAVRPEQCPSASWSEYEARSVYALGDRARLCDLAVMVRPEAPDRRDEFGLMEAVLFGSARPLMVVGREMDVRQVPAKITVAWNGGLEAARALLAARPLLAAAVSVTLLSIGDTPDGDLSPEAAADYLRLHGIAADASRVERSPFERAEDVMMRMADEARPDLVVMGAYSHSRLQQTVLGGFTRRFLHEATCPVLLVH